MGEKPCTTKTENTVLLFLQDCRREKAISTKKPVFSGNFRVCCSYMIAAEQKARAVYDNILRVCDDPDVANVIKYLREREIVHFQRFGGALNHLQSTIKCRKNEK